MGDRPVVEAGAEGGRATGGEEWRASEAASGLHRCETGSRHRPIDRLREEASAAAGTCQSHCGPASPNALSDTAGDAFRAELP